MNLKILDRQLDFDDVLIKPNFSNVKSRENVNLKVNIVKANSADSIFFGVPIMAANMDGVGTFAMAEALASFGMFTCLSKHYTKEEYIDWIPSKGKLFNSHWAYTTGINSEDLNKLIYLKSRFPDDIKYVCVDVANGYMESLYQFVSMLKNKYPDLIIISGNVVTPEATLKLLDSGASIIKIGIGSGCFSENTLVQTNIGKKKIKDIVIGDSVLTHTNTYKKVVNITNRTSNKNMLINGIECTPNHEFYVIEKKNKDVVTEKNIHHYAKWIPAEKLNKDYLIVSQN